jgi:hypothetical protein
MYKKREPNYFFKAKKEFLMEYVYQRLNGHPSNHWVNRKKGLNMELNDFRDQKKWGFGVLGILSSFKTLL